MLIRTKGDRHLFLTAFTLIELLVVMAIIGIIAGMLVGAGGAARRRAMETKAKSMIASLEIAISMYRVDVGNYPPDSGGPPIHIVYTRLTNAAWVNGWQGPYMEFKQDDLGIDAWGNTVIRDPWGNSYRYSIMDITPAPAIMWGNTNSYNLWSCGPDGNDDSGDGNADYGDDVYSW